MEPSEDLNQRGFQIFRSCLKEESLSDLREIATQLAELQGSPCVRGLFQKSSAIREFAHGAALRSCLPDEKMIPVRSILFDKTPESNWPVARHQDLTIAVRKSQILEGYGPWSMKEQIPHVQPPVSILKKMVTLRIHLDPTPAGNGALRVIPGSHALGKLNRERIDSFSGDEDLVCECQPGDVLAFRPLLVHSSRRSKNPSHRRIIHLEFAPPDILPRELQWADR